MIAASALLGHLERRFEALVLEWDDTAGSGSEHAVGRLAGLIEQAAACGLQLRTISAEGVTDRHRSTLTALWRQGIRPEQVLVLGTAIWGTAGADGQPPEDGFGPAVRASVAGASDGVPSNVTWIGGGRDAQLSILEDQIRRRAEGELPHVVTDPEWTLVLEQTEPHLERTHEALTTLADGVLGSRGITVLASHGADPAVLMSGIYAGSGAASHLLEAPVWNLLKTRGGDPPRARRTLDLRTGVLHERFGTGERMSSALQLSSLARPGTVVLRACGRDVAIGEPLVSSAPHCDRGDDGDCPWIRVSVHPGSVVAAAAEQLHERGRDRVLDRFAAYEGSPVGVAEPATAIDRARAARSIGFDRLLGEHRHRWASRWEACDIRIEGDPELQLAVRFSLFHLNASVRDVGEAAVGARGLSGRAYRGHVFWDSDVYVLPFLAATHPAAARAMLEYRVRRLPAALQAARDEQRQGARWPWESARSGRDVTPDNGQDHDGERLPILTGRLEQHIVADVAWAAACYLDWTGDQQFERGPGTQLLVQSARWWAARIESDTDGSGHIRDVIGPDEYHVHVDDNAFTNVMARWNLRRAAQLGADAVDQAERGHWLELAERLVDNYDSSTGIYEQFTGFHQLEPLLITDIATNRPVAADLVLGSRRTQAAQIIKQADALMLHYLVPDEVASGSLIPNLDFYDPRTAHGSTLSPGIHAALLARAGRLTEAAEALSLTARIDLDDAGHTTAGGLHMAAMGSVWGALVFGFAGLRPVGDTLRVDPKLPGRWKGLELRVRFRGSQVRIQVGDGSVMASGDRPVRLTGPGGEAVVLSPKPSILSWCSAPERTPR